MRTVKLDERLFRSEAENGVTVMSELLPWVRSVAVGIWVARASVHEPRSKMGVSHLLEHMVFKGTERRSARDIALELEVRGGSLDAYTSRDHTSFQARVLDEDLPRALDVLTDLVRNPALRADDLDRERKVVLEEISSVEDTPDDLVFELHSQTMWPDHPYGYSVLGSKESVSGLSVDDLRELHALSYHPGNVVIAAAGNVDHDLFLKLLAKCGWFTFDAGPEPQPVASVPRAVCTERHVERDGAQAHVVLGTDTFRFTDERRHPLVVLNSVLGAGMSSTLFQRVREELGLAYAVFSYQSFYKETGVVGIYVGTHPSNVQQALEAIKAELATLAAEGLKPERLAEAQQQLKGQVTLSLESPSARMYRLATIALFGEPYRTIDEVLVQIDAISLDDVATVGQEFFDPDRQTIVTLGPN
jgi:predicted Zn-dependent peptidase